METGPTLNTRRVTEDPFLGRRMPRLLEKTSTLALGEGGKARVVVIADTHSAPHPRSPELVAKETPDLILHAGDIGNLAVLATFAKIAPLTAVRGNIDETAHDLPDVVTLDITNDGVLLFKFLLQHIAVNGPKLRADALRRAQAKDASLVVCGHSHVPFLGRDRGFAIFNPGSIGPRRFQLPIVFGVIDIAPDQVQMKHVSCETGLRWMP